MGSKLDTRYPAKARYPTDYRLSGKIYLTVYQISGKMSKYLTRPATELEIFSDTEYKKCRISGPDIRLSIEKSRRL